MRRRNRAHPRTLSRHPSLQAATIELSLEGPVCSESRPTRFWQRWLRGFVDSIWVGRAFVLSCFIQVHLLRHLLPDPGRLAIGVPPAKHSVYMNRSGLVAEHNSPRADLQPEPGWIQSSELFRGSVASIREALDSTRDSCLVLLPKLPKIRVSPLGPFDSKREG